GWSYDPGQLPDFPEDPGYYPLFGGHIHDTLEGDDLWEYILMYVRTGEQGYLDRANAWAAYMLSTRYFEAGGLEEGFTTRQFDPDNKTFDPGGDVYGVEGVESQLFNDIRGNG